MRVHVYCSLCDVTSEKNVTQIKAYKPAPLQCKNDPYYFDTVKSSSWEEYNLERINKEDPMLLQLVSGLLCIPD